MTSLVELTVVGRVTDCTSVGSSANALNVMASSTDGSAHAGDVACRVPRVANIGDATEISVNARQHQCAQCHVHTWWLLAHAPLGSRTQDTLAWQLHLGNVRLQMRCRVARRGGRLRYTTARAVTSARAQYAYAYANGRQSVLAVST
jgi:hypothetical protein